MCIKELKQKFGIFSLSQIKDVIFKCLPQKCSFKRLRTTAIAYGGAANIRKIILMLIRSLKPKLDENLEDKS